MHRRRLVVAVVLLLLCPAPGLPGPDPLAVIVHPERRETPSVEELAQIYLRRKRFWKDGDPIVPLNLPAGTPLRAEFSHRVLREGQARVAEYWNRQYFKGVLPPPTLASTSAVLRYVASEPNAIGYVPASEADGTVRIVLHLESAGPRP